MPGSRPGPSAQQAPSECQFSLLHQWRRTPSRAKKRGKVQGLAENLQECMTNRTVSLTPATPLSARPCQKCVHQKGFPFNIEQFFDGQYRISRETGGGVRVGLSLWGVCVIPGRSSNLHGRGDAIRQLSKLKTGVGEMEQPVKGLLYKHVDRV